MGRRQPRSQHLPGLPIQSTPDDRTGVNIEPDTRTLTDHWGLPRLWIYRQGPSLSGNPRSSVAGPPPPYRLDTPPSTAVGETQRTCTTSCLAGLPGRLERRAEASSSTSRAVN